MSNTEIALRVLLRVARHPATQAFGKHVLRLATAALIKSVRTRARQPKFT